MGKRTEIPDNECKDPSLFDESWTRTWQTNRLVAMAKEPDTLFVYWEVTDLRKTLIGEHFQSDWASLPFFLQLYDITHIHFNGYNAHSTRRIPVHPLSDNWYIHGLEPGRHYQVDFGTVTLRGEFFAVLRSNIVEAPLRPFTRANKPSVRFGMPHWAREHGGDRQALLYGPERLPVPVGPRRIPEPNPPWLAGFDGYSLSGSGKESR